MEESNGDTQTFNLVNSSDTLTKSIDYVYDAFNRMVKRTLDSNGAASGGVSSTFWAGFDGICYGPNCDRICGRIVTVEFLGSLAGS